MFFVINFVFFSFLVFFLSTCDTVHRALLHGSLFFLVILPCVYYHP